MAPIKVTTVNPSTVYEPKPTYSHIALAPMSNATLVTISGQIPRTPAGTTPATFAEQVQAALDNLGACLKEVGLGPESIMKVTQYVVGEENVTAPARGELYNKFMGSHRPASSLVGVTYLAGPGLMYEIEATAIKENS